YLEKATGPMRSAILRALRARALADKHVGVRGAAASALQQLRDPEVVPALVKRVADDRWDIVGPDRNDPATSKEPPLAALPSLDTPRGSAALPASLKSSNASVRPWAADRLADQSDAPSLDALRGPGGRRARRPHHYDTQPGQAGRQGGGQTPDCGAQGPALRC